MFGNTKARESSMLVVQVVDLMLKLKNLKMKTKDVSCPKCKYKWTYKGRRLKFMIIAPRVYVTCPVCGKSINIQTNQKIKMEDLKELLLDFDKTPKDFSRWLNSK